MGGREGGGVDITVANSECAVDFLCVESNSNKNRSKKNCPGVEKEIFSQRIKLRDSSSPTFLDRPETIPNV